MTPRPVGRDETTVVARVREAVCHRCRRGEPEALSALLYSLADRLYTAASYVLPDEDSALVAVVAAWEDLLGDLAAPFAPRDLDQAAYSRLTLRLAGHAPEADIARAVHRVRDEDDDGLLLFPDAPLEALLVEVPAQADRIASRAWQRRRRLGQAATVMVTFAILLTTYNLLSTARARGSQIELRLTCLRDRVAGQDLVAVVRDTVSELGDPAGADRYEARLLQSAGLALEELSNTRGIGDRPLRYLSERVRGEDLAAGLGELMADREALASRELRETQLVLEEVATL